MDFHALNQEVGNLDIYLLDHILKGRFRHGMRILDAGCGEGRNLVYFIRNNFDVWGIDNNAEALRMSRVVGRSISPIFDPEKFLESDLSSLPFPPASFDAVICSAVLHFARTEEEFLTMFEEMIRVLRKEGLLFFRMTSDIGLEGKIKKVNDHQYELPDQSIRFLLTRTLYNNLLTTFKLQPVEPLKTVNVADVRCMSTALLIKV